MSDTKENILLVSLRLFARDGYEAVSVSRISGELGITKGALYKHYKNKRDIFDSIVARSAQLDKERALAFGVPADTFGNAPDSYQYTEWDNIRRFTLAQYRFWTTDEFLSSFRRMLSLEQYRNLEMRELYDDCIMGGPVKYMEDIFRKMMDRGILKKDDPEQLAIEYFAPMFLLISMSDSGIPHAAAESRLEAHINRFIQSNATLPEKN